MISYFQSRDPMGLGVVKYVDFRDMCLAVRPDAAEIDILRLARRYDTYQNGLINYQVLLEGRSSRPRLRFPRGPSNSSYGPLDPDIFPLQSRKKFGDDTSDEMARTLPRTDLIKLVGNSTDWARLRKDVENDVVLSHLAERTEGANLEEITREATTADEFVRDLLKLRVFVSADDIREMFDGSGKDGLLAAIHAKRVGHA
jgi:hypothetical protein